jgi:hypothetical protein
VLEREIRPSARSPSAASGDLAGADEVRRVPLLQAMVPDRITPSVLDAAAVGYLDVGGVLGDRGDEFVVREGSAEDFVTAGPGA